MKQHNPSAAGALYPHLKSQLPQPRGGQPPGTIAQALFPKLASLAPPPPQSPQGRLTFGYEVVPGLRRKGR
jgi:hypothetical protein